VSRRWRGYPLHEREVLVTACGRICMHRKRINVSTVLAGQKLGVKDVDEGIWIVSFMHYDLGYVDLEQKTLRPLDNPFGPRVLPTYVSGTDRYLCLRSVPTQGGGDGLFRQAAPALAKCDAPFPVPPFLPPVHRPAPFVPSGDHQCRRSLAQRSGMTWRRCCSFCRSKGVARQTYTGKLPASRRRKKVAIGRANMR
jgi:hypothetical protein